MPTHRSASLRSPRARWLHVVLLLAALLGSASSAPAATIAVGGSHACAVTSEHKVNCWGMGDNGQLGDGARTHRTRPVEVTGITTATEVSAGNSHSCALLADQTVRCWGANATGMAGTPGFGSVVPVTMSALTNVVAIDESEWTLCALTSDGRILCYGLPGSGANVGDWTSQPAQLDMLTGAADLTVDAGEVCAIGTSKTVCWSYREVLPSGAWRALDTPVVAPNSDAIQRRAGVCSLLASGQVGCESPHGPGWPGLLGDGNPPADHAWPRGSSVAKDLTDAVSVASMLYGQTCAARATGAVVCWGQNRVGVPDSGAGPLLAPTVRDDLENIRTIVASIGFACAVGFGGEVYCWGYNAGYLGDGTTEDSASAVRVQGLTAAASARDAITPIRRDEPDVAPTFVVPPTTPVATTPKPPAPPSSDLGGQTGPDLRPPAPRTPTLRLANRRVVLTTFAVPPQWAGRCPRTATVTVRASGRRASKTLAVQRRGGAACEVSGTIRLSGRLARASRVTVTVRPRGGDSIVRTLSAR